jgi:hypothetical protein
MARLVRSNSSGESDYTLAFHLDVKSKLGESGEFTMYCLNIVLVCNITDRYLLQIRFLLLIEKGIAVILKILQKFIKPCNSTSSEL